MYVISNLVSITDGVFVFSSVNEPDLLRGEVAWVSGATYTLGFEVVDVTNHKKYKNIQAGSNTVVPSLDPTRWTESGISNKWAAVDLLRNTQSISTGDITIILNLPKAIDSLGLVGLFGDSVEIRLNNGASDIYTYTQSLYYFNPTDWYEWHFGDFKRLQSIIRLDLPPVSNCVLTIKVKAINNLAMLGGVHAGTKMYLGELQYGASNQGMNFSRVDRNIDGSAILIPRATKPRKLANLSIPKNKVSQLLDVRSDLSGITALWTGLDDKNIDDYFDLFLINGVWKQFEIDATHPTHATIQLEVEEL